MAWRDTLRPASFRGVPFFISSADGEHGRRHAVHLYPGRDEPFLEDMGRRSRDRWIEAYVLEPDHIGRAKALAEACEIPGPGTFVHPWLGEFSVICTNCRQTFTSADAGMATFALAFSDAGAARYPAVTTNAASAIDFGSLQINEASTAEFTSGFSIANVPDFVATEGASMLQNIGATIKDTLSPLITGAGIAASWQRGISDLIIGSANLIRTPSTAVQKVLASMDMGGLIGNIALSQTLFSSTLASLQFFTGEQPFPSWRAWLPLTNFDPNLPSIPSTTSARLQQNVNRQLLTSIVRRGAAAQAARAVSREAFPTYEQAIVARDTIVEILDRETDALTPETIAAIVETKPPAINIGALRSAQDAAYRAITTLRTSVVAAITAAAPDLPRLIEYTPASAVPSLALACHIYGDNALIVPERSDEILSRNRVAHPLFVPGGTPIRLRTI